MAFRKHSFVVPSDAKCDAQNLFRVALTHFTVSRLVTFSRRREKMLLRRGLEIAAGNAVDAR
jgi:hypothetical protein